jgi:hypothetical protein
MKIVSEVKTQQELQEMKAIMKIFLVNDRIRVLARSA